MPARLYNEYIKVDPNFIPVFSSNSDQVYPDKWQSFYPHESFKNILTSLIETLEKGSSKNDLSLWINGSYGTGKTYASFTIKHILEDPIETVSTYFETNKMTSLLTRVKGIRAKGDILVVHKSSSANINTQNKLFSVIMESVKKTLHDKNYKYMGSVSLLDKVITTLKDSNSLFNFNGAFQKYRARFTEYTSAESVIRDLEELDGDEQLDLLDTIIGVAEEENYNWATTPEEIIDWLEDVRVGNGIYSIVFIWDEFTEYFKNNPNNITGLQEIAMASSRINFYFLLITHSDANQLISDQASRKIIEARFKMLQLRLAESTAFILMGQALHIENDLSEDWKGIQQSLLSDVKHDSISLIEKKDMTMSDNDFVSLLPMHPYAAYLLKFIAQDISSNQRTIFQFLSGDYIEENTEKKNFKWFIDKFGFEYGSWNYLTVDYLWDYFFLADNVDLEGAFTEAISYFNNFSSICDTEDRKRILKTVLLLSALQTQNGSTGRSGATSLFRPTLCNIKACFAGTPMERSVKSNLDYLKNKGILGAIETGSEDDTIYVMASTQVDKERMDKMVEEARTAFKFEKILNDSTYNPVKQFLPNDYLQFRCDIYNITFSNYRRVADLINVTPNKIITFYLFAQNEADQSKTTSIVSYLRGRFNNRLVIVDFTSLPFTDSRYEKFVSSKGKEKYWGSIPNQSDQLQLAKRTSENIVKEWSHMLLTAPLQVYSYKNTERIVSVVGGANLRKELREINSNMYGCGLEEISVNEKLFEQKGYKETVAQIAMGKATIPTNYSYLNFISSSLNNQGIWNTTNYASVQPNHPVSKMKNKVQEVIENGFNTSGAVKISDIWNALKQPPFGLLPCTGSVFLFGFLMKDYNDGTYYIRDINNNTVTLNYINLSELIYAVVKNLPKAENQYIVKQKPSHISFCNITGDIFKISKDKRNSIEDVAKNLNIYLTNNNYPLWALKYYIKEEYNDNNMRDAMIKIVDLLCEFVNPQNYVERSKTNIAEEIYEIYKDNTGIDTLLSEIVGVDFLRKGMEYYIAEYKPELITVASKLKIDSNEYLSMLNKKLSFDSSYLWKMGDINHQIDNLYIDLCLLDAINHVLTSPQKKYQDARQSLIEKLNIIKIPDAYFIEECPNLKDIMQCFYAIRNDRVLDSAAAAKTIDSMADEFLSVFNNQIVIFETVIHKYIDESATTKEIEHLFSQVNSGTLFNSTDEFNISMANELRRYRKKVKQNSFISTWENVSHTKNPAEWSQKNDIPISCVFCKEENFDFIQRVFDALNGNIFLLESEIDRAIKFIKGPQLNLLNDLQRCRTCFIAYFCGEYAYVIDDYKKLSDTLRKAIGDNVYGWFSKRQMCEEYIQSMAKELYQSKFKNKAREKIHGLNEKEAKSYLENLIESDTLLGINILKS